ncbi:tRNA epoxyqueuosine(34) reductase QueG [Anaerosporobacter sp.]
MKEKIENFCSSLGLDTIGFIPCRAFEELREFYQYRQDKNLQNEFEEKDINKRIHPSHYMEDAKTILSIAFPYYHDEEKVDNGFSIYTKRFDYHRVVMAYLGQICEFIRSLGGKAEAFVDSNTLPERYIAYLAGVGFIGRNNMVITKKYGSYVFLGEIITDLEIPCEDKRTFDDIRNYAECGECTNCLKECPTKSINKKQNNPNICLSYITQKKEITKREISLLKGNVFGCDFCQLKCPYNEGVASNVLPEFKTLDYMNEDLSVYAGMNNQYFKEKISKTSCGWRGKNVIKRNAIIGINYQNKDQDLNEFRGDSPYINEYIDKLRED